MPFCKHICSFYSNYICSTLCKLVFLVLWTKIWMKYNYFLQRNYRTMYFQWYYKMWLEQYDYFFTQISDKGQNNLNTWKEVRAFFKAPPSRREDTQFTFSQRGGKIRYKTGGVQYVLCLTTNLSRQLRTDFTAILKEWCQLQHKHVSQWTDMKWWQYQHKHFSQ